MKLNRKNPLLLTAITVAGLGFSASSLHAQTWTGATDTFWTEANNWNPSGVPAASSAVQFDGTGANLNTSFNATSFTLNSLTFTAAQTAQVTINTTFANPLSFNPGTVLSVAAGDHRFVGNGTTTTNRDMLFTGTVSTDTYTFDIATGASFEIKGRIGSNGTGASTRTYIKTGPGTLLLSGSNGGSGAWTHGGLQINDGVVRAANTNALGLSANKFTVSSGAALEFFGGFNAGQINAAHTISGTGIGATGALRNISGNNALLGGGTGNITLGANSSIGADADTLTIATNINDGGNAFSLTKVGAGTLVLSGANTYTGATSIAAGTLGLANATPLGTIPGTNGTSAISMVAGPVLQSNTVGGSTIAAPITLSGAGNHNFRIGQGAAGTTHTFNINGAIGGTTTNVVYSTSSGSFNNGTSRFIIGAAGTYTGDTLISTLNGGNNPVFVRAGAGIVNALPATTVLTFNNIAGGGTGRTFQYEMNGGDQTLAGLNNTGLVPNLRRQLFTNAGAFATLTINNTADYTFGGSTVGNDAGASTTRAQITGAIALTKTGVGTFTLGGNLTNGATEGGNTFTGATKVLGGILNLGETISIQNSAFDTASSITGNGTNGLRTTVTALTLGGLIGSQNFADVFTTATGGPANLTARGGYDGLTALTLNPSAGATNSYGGDIGIGAGSMSLTKTGAGTQILSGANSYTGAYTISAGTLQFAEIATLYSSSASWTAANIKVASTGTLALNVGGANEFTPTDVTTLLSALGGTNGTTTTGFAAGSSIGFDTTNATGGTFTVADTIADSTGTGGGSIGLTKLGINTLVLSGLSATAASNYSGLTTINEGTLTFTTSPSLTGGLTFGVFSSVTTPGILDLTSVDATFGGALNVISNSTANEIKIGPSQTLTIGTSGTSIHQIGAVTPAVTGTTTSLNMTGGGTLNVTGDTFAIAASSSSTLSQTATLDLTALNAATINLTGNFRISPNTTQNIGGQGKLFLPTPTVADTVLTANITTTGGAITVGGGGAFTGSVMNTLQLGTGLTKLNANTINVGSGSRDLGQIIYGQLGGDLIIRAGDGTSRATLINVGATNGATGAFGPTIRVNLAGHDADILVSTLNVGNQARVNNQAYEFNFGVGDNSLASTLDATNVNVGFRVNNLSTTTTLTSKVNLSGGTVTFGDVGATGTGVDIGSSTYVLAGVAPTVAELNIINGNVTINNSTSLGAAVRLGTNSDAVDAGGTVTASLNLTGGTTTLGGDIIRGLISPRTTSTVKLSGGILNMGNNDIGTATELITLTAESGALSNVATINGTGGLTKTSAGTLTVSGTTGYVGNTAVNEGTLTLGSINSANEASTVSIAATGATLNLTYGGTDTVGKLFIGASQLPAGIYGPTATALSQITGGGTLTVGSNPTYASWIDFFFPGATNPSIIGANADPDNDGIGNGVEMVIGGDPKNGMDTALLPTLELVTDPVSSPAIPAGNYLLFTYRRSDSSVIAGVVANCETDTDLVAPWTTAIDAASGVVIQVDNNFSFTPAATADTDRVRVYVPRGANTTLFGRLNVVVP